jgi:tRNA G46 methylase TrmB
VIEAMARDSSNRSRTVRSAQISPHPRLEAVVKKHLQSEWREPLHAPSVRAFQALQSLLPGIPEKLILDSGCGTGDSTRRLARRRPDWLVLGVDKSAARLCSGGATKFPHREDNLILLRADLATFWRLALESGWRLRRHYLLYPNPWPKPGQLKRRWHAHPVFPTLLQLGGRLEMRCNWAIYAQEFAAALNLALGTSIQAEQQAEADPISPFERKYRASGHALYSVVVPAGLIPPAG